MPRETGSDRVNQRLLFSGLEWRAVGPYPVALKGDTQLSAQGLPPAMLREMFGARD